MGEAVREFVIPLEKDELLVSRAGLYSVEEIVPPAALLRVLDATRTILQNDGPAFILDHFDTFFSVLVHGNKLELSITLKAFERILKAIDRLIGEMDEIFDRGGEIRSEERPRYLCINKMYAYLLSSLCCYIEDYINKQISRDMDSIGKKKKAAQKSDAEEHWESSRQKALESIYRWLQLPLQKLWSPPIVDDLFITVLAQFCYKVLEQNREARQKQLRETIFQILGTLVKNYNHGITCVVRIIQLVKLYEALAAPLAAGVVHLVTEAGCPGFIKEMVREIGHGEPGEADARNISTFLEAISSAKPDFILPILDNLTEYLANDCYTMRNCAIGVIGSVVLGALTAEAIDDERREKRDECLSMLEEHFIDSNSYVRSKVLQVWQRLCCNGAIPLANQGSVLKAAALRLEDKSANVRKQALQLLRALLQGNPFAAKLDKEKFTKQLEEAKAKLKELKVLVASLSPAGGDERAELWNALLPEIRKALTQITAEEKDDDDDKDTSSDEEPEEAAEAPQLVADDEFEKVRQLLLTEEVFQAVTYLKKICKNLPGCPDMSAMSKKQKEDSLFIFLLKIFKESEKIQEEEEGSATARQNNADSQQTNETTRKKEFKKRKEELRQQRALVNYIEYCLEFAHELENVIPIAKTMLFSSTAGDAVEACSFLGTACQFEVPNALSGVRESLFQVFSRDQSVRKNVAAVYKEIYLASRGANQGAKQKAITSVNGLLALLRGLSPGQSPALCQLVGAWRLDGELGDYELQIMWEKFSLKIPVDHPEDSRAALILLTMAAEKEPSLLTANLEVLMKVGFGERAKNDLLLARDTCRALLKIKQDSGDPEKQPIRYPNDHAMFEQIITLVLDNFDSVNDNGYISFVNDAINVIYHLADQPDALIKRVLIDIAEKGHFFANENEAEEAPENSQPSSHLLSRLLYIVGHISIREMVHLDNGVYKELKRRNAVREIKKGDKGKKNARNPKGNPASTPMNASRHHGETPSSAGQTLRHKKTNNTTVTEDNGEETLEGAVADDADAECVTAALENDILAGDGILAKFVPIVLDVCRHPEKYNDEQLQVWGVLALSKMMTISSLFCVDHLQLLVTIMERSADPRIRANVLVGLCDLTARFPNQVEPWTGHIYGRLRDDNVKVRSTCVRMLSSLIMREMIRVKGQVSGLTLCMIDSEPQIRENTKQFFKDLSCKGNTLYNVIPDIISRLMDPELKLKEDEFQEIIKYVLGLLQKERQIDTIIDKLCSRFKLATTKRQWRDLSYCLSQLQFNAKSIRRLIESLPLLKEKIHHKQVLKSLHAIIETTKRKPDAKTACIELEEKIEQMLKVDEEANGPIDDRLAMPPPPVPKQKKSKRKSNPHRGSSSEEDDDDEDDQEDSDLENNQMHNITDRTPSIRRKRIPQKTPRRAASSSRERISNSDSDSDEETKTAKKTSRTPARATPARNSGKRKKENAESSAPSPSRPQPKRNKQFVEPTASTSGTTPARRSSSRISKKNR